MAPQGQNCALSFLEMEQEDGSTTIVTLVPQQPQQEQEPPEKQSPAALFRNNDKWTLPSTSPSSLSLQKASSSSSSSSPRWRFTNTRQSILLALALCYVLVLKQMVSWWGDDSNNNINLPMLQPEFVPPAANGLRRLQQQKQPFEDGDSHNSVKNPTDKENGDHSPAYLDAELLLSSAVVEKGPMSSHTSQG